MADTFIKTSDIETAEKLRKLGFKEIKMNNGLFSFVNNTKIGQFSYEIDTTKVIYSNKMTF